MRISYSAIDTFLICPAKFRFSQIDKIKTPKSKEAVFGTLIHSALKTLHQPSVIPPTEDEILQYFNNNWTPDIFTNQAEEVAFLHQGVTILKNYYAKNHPSKFNIIDLETSFASPIALNDKTFFVTGKIDRIDKLSDGQLEIIDYKTTKKMPSQQAVDENLQLSIYHLGLADRWPSLQHNPIKVSLYYLKHGEKLSTIRTAENLKQTKEQIIKVLGNIEKCLAENKFEPRPNPLCDWCDYQSHCPFFRHKFRKEEVTPDSEQINQLTNEYLELKIKSDELAKKMAEIKTLLGAYCDKENIERLFGDNGQITRTLQKRFEYDFELARQILEPIGIWPEVLSIDSIKFKKAAKSLPPDVCAKLEEVKKLKKEFKTLTVKFVKK